MRRSASYMVLASQTERQMRMGIDAVYRSLHCSPSALGRGQCIWFCEGRSSCGIYVYDALEYTFTVKAASKELERIDHVFYTYAANTSSAVIDPEGIERLCADMEVDPTDVRVLMLAWKMKAEKQGYFTLEEWRVALKALRADSLSKVKKALPELEKEVRRPSNFVDFYSYGFKYCLTEEKQKSIDIESICQLLHIILGSQYQAQVNSFVEYLKIQNDYKVLNMDQWMGFYRFCDEISYPDLSNYDPELAWPLILDNFVEWVREKQS